MLLMLSCLAGMQPHPLVTQSLQCMIHAATWQSAIAPHAMFTHAPPPVSTAVTDLAGRTTALLSDAPNVMLQLLHMHMPVYCAHPLA